MNPIISPETIITAAFDQFFQRDDGLLFKASQDMPGLGLAFTVGLDMENYGYERDGNTHHEEWRRRYNTTIHVIVTCRHRVYVALVPDRDQWFTKPWELPVSLWENTSNHDSCWRSDGLRVFHSEVRAAYEQCFAWMPEEHRSTWAHARSSLHTVWGTGLCTGPLFSVVRVVRKEHEDEKIRQQNYRDQLASVEEVKLQVSLI